MAQAQRNADILNQAAETEAKAEVEEAASEQVNEPRERYTQSDTYQHNRKHLLGKLDEVTSDFQPFGEADTLGGRYKIDMTRELPVFSKRYAKAYAAEDSSMPERRCFAYVTEPYHPYRAKVLKALKDVSHPHMLEVLDSGPVYVSQSQSNRFVIVYQQPEEAVSLKQLLKDKDYIKSIDALKQLITPIASVMQKLDGLGIHHGSICPANIFKTKEGIMLGDAVAEPAGSMQPMLYEPRIHMQAVETGKGEGSLHSDMYALAILVLDMCNELGNRNQLSREQLLSLLLTRGAYATFISETSMPEHLVDFFRATLVDKLHEGWNISQLSEYISGKRFNLIPPNYPRDCSRAHDFNEIEHYNMPQLAHDYHQAWEQGFEDLKQNHVVKWLDSLTFKSEMKERLDRIHSRAAKISGKNENADELVTRAIILLDPEGPLRVKTFAVMPDHLSHFYADMSQKGDLQKKLLFQMVIRNELVSSWQESDPMRYKYLDYESSVLRHLMAIKTIGFGMERLLYELNPHIPCMSRDYLPYYATNLTTMLHVLDHLAAQKTDDSFLDRHLIAFLAARAGIRKDIKLKEYRHYPNLANHTELKAIIVIARAQEKAKIASLPGLCCWAALRVSIMIEEFHSRDTRQRFSRDLHAVTPKGKLTYIVRILQNKDYLDKDAAGFIKASKTYYRNYVRIAKLKDKKTVFGNAHRKGLRVAFGISIAILFGVSYFVLAKYAL